MVIGLAFLTSFSCLASVQSVVSRYSDAFMQEDKQLLRDLAAARGFSESAWEKFKKEQYPLFLQVEAQKRAKLKTQYPQPADTDMQHYFKRALQVAGMSNIELINVQPNNSVDMYALAKAICVNGDVVHATHANNNEIIATFLHELGHIQYQDCFMRHCVNELRKYPLVMDVQIWNDLQKKQHHLREKRADLTAVLGGYINGRISFFARDNFPESDGHPSAHDHVAYLQSLKNQL